MEIREFCEQLLFSTRLEDKLYRPAAFEDACPGEVLATVKTPGRPVGLEIDKQGPKVAFPGLHELQHVEAHGRALHFFANHELMALELMALVLLRFPDAPPEFRMGLARIIGEEQTHFELYRDRALECGVEFGQYPLNSYFWNILSGVTDPLNAVAAVNLTLEQANLDYAAYYARAFRKIGAEKTALVLDRILEDEVGHLAYGVHWYREWLGQDVDLFEAHAAHLHLPLSMSRARGYGFVVEPRLRAGLPADYVAKMAALRGSRGRPPVVHWFNAAGSDDFRRDLETLPLFFAGAEDIVLTEEPPADAFLAELEAAGIQTPAFLDEVPGSDDHPHLGDLRPWDWSPDAQKRMRHLFGRLVSRPRYYEQELSADLGQASTPDLASSVARALRERCAAPWMATGTDTVGAARAVVCQLSMCMQIDEPGVGRVQRTGRFLSDVGGRYRGGFTGRLSRALTPEVQRFINGDGYDPQRVPTVMTVAAEEVSRALKASGYVGPVGVDTAIARDDKGALRFDSVVRVTAGTTMGHVCVALDRHIAPDRVGVWLLFGLDELREAGFEDAAALSESLRAKCPATMVRGKLDSGALMTTDPKGARSVATVLFVGRDAKELAAMVPVPAVAADILGTAG